MVFPLRVDSCNYCEYIVNGFTLMLIVYSLIGVAMGDSPPLWWLR